VAPHYKSLCNYKRDGLLLHLHKL